METAVTIGLYVLFFGWCYAAAYVFGYDPSNYRYIMGFHEWFFYSCIVGYIGISALLALAVKLFFKDIPPDEDDEDV